MTENPKYHAGTAFNTKTGVAGNFYQRLSEIAGIKVNAEIAEIWEICALFTLAGKSHKIAANNANVVPALHALAKLSVATQKTPNLTVCRYTDVAIDENAGIHILMDTLPKLIKQQAPTNMIIQLAGTLCDITAQLVTFFASHYSQAYLVKPMASPELADYIYLVLLDLKHDIILPKIQQTPTSYLMDLGILVPEFVQNTIQCMNSELIFQKYNRYHIITKFLQSKIYEGASYEALVQQQQENAELWITQYDKVDAEKFAQRVIEKLQKSCMDQYDINRAIGDLVC